MEVMMLLTTDKVIQLQRIWEENDMELELLPFVNTMRETLAGHITDEVEFTQHCIELFKQIDVNGDGGVDWDEFSGFMFQIGAIQEHKPKEQSHDKRFFPTSVQDTNYHSSRIELMYLISALDKFALLQHKSDVVQLYSLPSTHEEAPRQTGILRHHTAFKAHQVLTCEFIEQQSVLVTSSVASAAGPCYLSMWDLSDSLPVLVRRVQAPSPQTVLHWSTRAQSLFTASASSDPMLIWNPQTWRRRHQPLHNAGIVAMLEAERGAHTVLCTASLDGSVRIWGVDRHERYHLLVNIEAHEHGCRRMCHSSQHHMLVTCGTVNPTDARSHDILLWRITDTSGRVSRRLQGHAAQVEHMVTTDTHGFVVSADASGAIKTWDISSCACLQTFSPSATLGQLRTFVLVPALRERVELLIAGGEVMEPFALQNMRIEEPLLVAEFNETFQMFMTVTAKEVVLWDARTGKFDRSYDTELLFDDAAREITSFCLDDRQRKVIVGNERGEISVHNYINGALMKQLDPHPTQVSQVLYADVSKVVVSLSVDSDVQLLDEADADGYYKPTAGQPLSVRLRTIALVTDADYEGGTSAVVGTVAGDMEEFYGANELSDWDSSADEYSSDEGGSPLTSRSARSVKSLPSLESSSASVTSVSSRRSRRPRPRTTRPRAFQGSDVPTHLLPFKTEGAVAAPLQLKPEVTCISADYHLNVIVTASQTTAYDTFVHVWDFEMLRLLGTCVQPGDAPNRRRKRTASRERTVAELTALATMSPFPAVVGGNAIGDTFVWPIRPSPLAYRCLIALDMPPAQPNSSVATQITALVVATGAEQDGGATVFAADNFGRVAAWELGAQTLSDLTLRPAEHQRQPDYRPFRHAHKQMPYSDMLVMKGVAIRGQQRVKVLDVDATRLWTAHVDSVSCLRYIKHPPSLLTASVDGLAKIWSLDGRLLGRLDINRPRGNKIVPWRYNLDVEEHDRRLREKAAEVLAEANAELSDDSGSDAGGSGSDGDGSDEEGEEGEEDDDDEEYDSDDPPLEEVLKQLNKFEEVINAENSRKEEERKPWEVPTLLGDSRRPPTREEPQRPLSSSAMRARARARLPPEARPQTGGGLGLRRMSPLEMRRRPSQVFQRRIARRREVLLTDRVPQSGVFRPGRQRDGRMAPLLGHSVSAGSLDYGYGEVNKSNYKALGASGRQRVGTALLKREARSYSLG